MDGAKLAVNVSSAIRPRKLRFSLTALRFVSMYAPALVFVTAASLLACCAPAQATTVQQCGSRSYELPGSMSVVCSATWQFQGPCDGADLWDRWKVHGQPGAVDGAFIRPWADKRIVVIGYELTKLGGEPHASFAIGSGIQPDIFLWMPADRQHARILFPAGAGHPWPSKSEAQVDGHNNLVDIHGSCAPAQVQPAPPEQPGSPGFVRRVINGYSEPRLPVQLTLAQRRSARLRQT
jgi:hypothetical protein